MAYEIHIERRGVDSRRLPISLSEWCAVVERTDGVRMAEGDVRATNPKTGELIGIKNGGGDAEAFFPDNGAWLRAFRWSPSGRISFRAPRDFEIPTSAIRLIAQVLAHSLDARLVGDEGEIYD
jgi:hypothetical protein